MAARDLRGIKMLTVWHLGCVLPETGVVTGSPVEDFHNYADRMNCSLFFPIILMQNGLNSEVKMYHPKGKMCPWWFITRQNMSIMATKENCFYFYLFFSSCPHLSLRTIPHFNPLEIGFIYTYLDLWTTLYEVPVLRSMSFNGSGLKPLSLRIRV